MEQRTIRHRFWIETILAGTSGLLALLTVASRDWIEAIFKIDPDQHSGSLEWLLVTLLVALTIGLSAVARAELLRTHS